MKTLLKNRMKAFAVFGFIFVVFAFICGSFSPFQNVVYAENVGEKIQVNFINKSDKILQNSEEFLGDIYYNQTQNRLETESGEALNLKVSTATSTEYHWYVYNSQETNGFEVLSDFSEKEFDLLQLVQKVYSASNKSNYIINGKISVLSVKENDLSLQFNVDGSVYANGKIYVSGVEIKNQITLNKNTNYNFEIITNNHYSFKSAKIFNGEESIPAVEKTENSFAFTTGSGAVESHRISAEYEKVEYSINLLAKDRTYNDFDAFVNSEHISKTSTTGKVDETFNDQITISSTNNFRFVKCVIFNRETRVYDDFNLAQLQNDNTALNADFYSNYADDENTVEILVLFDKLFEIKVSAVGNGNFVGYVNEELVESDKYQNGIMTVYVSSLDNLTIYMVPDDGFVVSSISSVSDSEITGGKIVIENANQNREIQISYEKFFYNINVYAFDNNNQRLSHFDSFSKIYVNGNVSNKIRIGDALTKIETLDSGNSDYSLNEYSIYNYTGNRFEIFTEGAILTDEYVTEGDNNVYIKATYSRLYTASVYIDSLSEDAGYFKVELLNSNGTVADSLYNITNFERVVSSGMKIRVTASAYRGYEFSSFTLENTNPVDNYIITKEIKNEDVSVGLVYKKVPVDVKISSISKHANIQCLSSETVQVGDIITISYEIDFAYALKNVYVNNTRADKLNNVSVTDNSIMITITKDFLKNLDTNGNIVINAKTTHDASFISIAIVIPSLILVLLVGAIVAVVYFVKAKKKLEEISSSEIMKKQK